MDTRVETKEEKQWLDNNSDHFSVFPLSGEELQGFYAWTRKSVVQMFVRAISGWGYRSADNPASYIVFDIRCKPIASFLAEPLLIEKGKETTFLVHCTDRQGNSRRILSFRCSDPYTTIRYFLKVINRRYSPELESLNLINDNRNLVVARLDIENFHV